MTKCLKKAMDKDARDRILNICTELGEDMNSPNCRKLREYVKTCPDSQAFVDSVRKTINLYRAYDAAPPEQLSKRLLQKLGLD